MSFGDEHEPTATPSDGRVLSPADLVDFKLAAERGWQALGQVLYAFKQNDTEDLVDALGTIADTLTYFRSELQLDSVDDDDDDDELDPSDPQKMDVSRWGQDNA